jgi:hypothetical protein
MDESIRIVPPEFWFNRGAQAYDQGLGIDDHNMNPWSPAVADFRKGWQQRQAERAVDQLLALAMVMEAPT